MTGTESGQDVLIFLLCSLILCFGLTLLSTKEIYGRKSEILADKEESLHRRKPLSVLYEIHVVHILSESQAHLTGRHAPFVPQVTKSVAK